MLKGCENPRPPGSTVHIVLIPGGDPSERVRRTRTAPARQLARPVAGRPRPPAPRVAHTATRPARPARAGDHRRCPRRLGYRHQRPRCGHPVAQPVPLAHHTAGRDRGAPERGGRQRRGMVEASGRATRPQMEALGLRATASGVRVRGRRARHPLPGVGAGHHRGGRDREVRSGGLAGRHHHHPAHHTANSD